MLIPSARISRALELGCAEGHFTPQLAPRVDRLIATDISHIALGRAAKRCVGLKNVCFLHFDLANDPFPGQFDLIVCSEVLYFMGGKDQLRAVAQKDSNSLEPGGCLLMAHASLVVDDPGSAGFDWDLPFGAKFIGETMAHIRNLQLLKELRTPLYRIHLFQRRGWFSMRRKNPEIIELAQQLHYLREAGTGLRLPLRSQRSCHSALDRRLRLHFWVIL